MKEVKTIDLIYVQSRGEKWSISKILGDLSDNLEGYLALDDGIIHVILNTVTLYNIPRGMGGKVQFFPCFPES